VKLEDEDGDVYSFLFLDIIAVRSNAKDLNQDVDCEFYSMRSNNNARSGVGGGGGRGRGGGKDLFFGEQA